MDSCSSSWVYFPPALTIQNGGDLGVALMENALADFHDTLPFNQAFVSTMLTLFVTQSSKLFWNFCKERKWNFRLLLASQGMPSTRSAVCSALATSVALSHGVSGPQFALSLGFGLIVMCDAVAIRRHVGIQARAVNRLLDVVFEDSPVDIEKLEEDVGNTLPQVFVGAMLGSAVAILCSLGFMFLH
ncbi:unnamed protein product [Lathyrus sativus]|nr:unnamed protein product [Lathyrus sativus]